MRKYLELPLKLFLITFILGLILGVTYIYTKEPIAEQIAAKLQESRNEAYPECEFTEVDEAMWREFVTEDGEYVKEVFEAQKDGQFAGYVVTVLSKGYGGDVELIIGIDTEGMIVNVVVGSHNETAGLGANAVKPEFRNQFQGKKSAVLKKDEPDNAEAVDGLTGATITSRAVTRGINKAVGLVEKLMEAQG